LADKKVYDAGDETQVKEKKTKATLEKEREQEELRQLLEDKKFRKFVWKVLSECGVYQEAFTGNSHTFYNEGKRKIGVWLIAQLISSSPKSYVQLQLENIEDSE